MTQKQIEKAVESIEDRAKLELERYCETVRQAVVIPFCKKHDRDFVSGMGIWGIRARREDQDKCRFESYSEEAARSGGAEFYRLYQILETPSSIINGCPIGSYMQDYINE